MEVQVRKFITVKNKTPRGIEVSVDGGASIATLKIRNGCKETDFVFHNDEIDTVVETLKAFQKMISEKQEI